MPAYPLKYLAIYKVKQNFASDRGYENGDHFIEGQRIQYMKKASNIYDMMEFIHFKDMSSGKELVWNTRVENVYDYWQDYLEPDQQ